MENKYFNCYKCHLYNNFYIPKGIKGKKCKRCHSFNFFKKKKKFHRNIFNNHRGSIFPRISNENSINNYHNEDNNFSNVNSININNDDSESNSDSDSDNSDFGFHENYFLGNSNNNILNNINNNHNYNNNNNNIIEEDNINNIDISWITKVKMNQSIIDKYGKDYECPICLLELKDEIHLTKCGHAFHYKCIVDAIKKNINECPICRCSLRTGEKKQSDSVQNVNINIINNNINNNINNYENNVGENNRIEINRNNNRENNNENNSIRNNKDKDKCFMIYLLILLLHLLYIIFEPFKGFSFDLNN